MTGRYGRYLNPYFTNRRNGKERRRFSYTIHIPERRTGKDRRSGSERGKTSRQIIVKPVRGDKSTAFDEFS